MATKTTTTKAKKTVKKPVTVRSLIAQARALLKEEDETLTEFRKTLKEDPSEYGKCKTGTCKFCDVARLIRRADKLKKAA